MSEDRNRGRGRKDDADLDAIAEVLDDLDFGRQTEPLAPPLGAPPPLPPPPELDDEDVLSSAPRPAPRSLTMPRVRELTPPPPPPTSDLDAPPTDDEVFGSDLDAELEDVFAAIGAPPSKPKSVPAPVQAAKRQEHDESTRIAEVEGNLLERSAREEPRRTAAVVRRDQLAPKDPNRKTGPSTAMDAAPAGAFEDQTRIADLLPERELSHQEDPEPEPAPQIALDESFYDDIEIKAGNETGEVKAIEQRPATVPPQRRVTQNVVRRATPKSSPATAAPPGFGQRGAERREAPSTDEPVGGPLLEDLFADGASSSAPAGAEEDLGETINRDARRARGGSPLEEAVAEFAATTGQSPRPPMVEGDDYDSFSSSQEQDLPAEAWAEALDRARADVPEPASADDAPVDDGAVGTFSIDDVEPPSARRAPEARGPRERRPRNPIPEATEVYVDLPLDLDALAIRDGGKAEPSAEALAERQARLLDEVEEARRAELPPRELARIILAVGQACEATGDRVGAADFYDEAIHLDETFAPALRAHRRLLLATGKYAAAARLLDVEVNLAGPDERAALAAFRGNLLVAVGDEDLARVAFGELVDARPDDVRSLLAQLELAYADGRDDEVAAILDSLVPHVTDARLAETLAVLRGRLAEKQRRTADAARAYEAAKAAYAESRPAAWGRGRLALAGGRIGEAAQLFPEMLAGVNDPNLAAAAQRQRMLAALAAGDSALAIAAAEAGDGEGDALVLETMAEAYSWAARGTETVLALQAWADVEPAPARRAEILRRLAVLHAAAGDDAGLDLENTLAQIVAANPGDADAREELAARKLLANDIKGAAAIGAMPGDIGASLGAARLYERSGMIQEAAEALAELAPIVGDSLVYAEARAGLYARAGGACAGKLAALLAEQKGRDWREPSVAAERLAWAAQAWAAAAGTGADTEAEEGAVAAWRALQAIDPGAEAAHEALVGRARAVAEAGGDPQPLVEALANVAAATRDPARLAAAAVEQAALLLKGGAEAEAIRAPLDRAHAVAPGEARTVSLATAIAAARGELTDYATRLGERADLLALTAERAGKRSAEADALRFRGAAALALDPTEAPRALETLSSLLDARPGFAGAGLVAEQAARAAGDPGLLVTLGEKEIGSGGPLEPARLLRMAELHEQTHDSTRAASRYRALLELRPRDPMARAGFGRVAEPAGALAALADLALDELKQAEEDGDAAAKIAAWEQLAHVDGDLRGDRASATLAWESILALDPRHPSAQRALERTYLEDGLEQELAELYARLAATLAESDAAPDAVPLLHLKARLSERQGEGAVVLADLRRVAELAPGDRAALFRLESRARETGPPEELSRWDDAIAAHFEGDPRAQAAFLTRAAESLIDGKGADRVDQAVSRYRAAVAAAPGFFPALRGWLRLALAEERWGDVAQACEQMAEVARSDGERARLHHLAGVAAMDRAGDPERAISDLRHVLALDPRHEDAFRRLRKLLTTHARHADLAELLGGRVEIETEPMRLVELHATLASIHRDALGDPERAKAHLRAVLGRDPRNLAAVSSLGDIAWGLGQWGEAAEALITRARLENDPQLLKETFFRLGVIYSDHLPDRRWALKSFERVLGFDQNDARALEYVSNLAVAGGEWRLALGATERLAGLDLPDVHQRAGHILRIAKIQEEGFADAKRAEEALKRAHDLDPTNPQVLAAIVAFYQRRKDLPTLRVHLDRTAGTMRWRLAKDPMDGTAYRVLARALAVRGQLGVVGSLEAARAAAELAHALGAADDVDLALIAESPPPSARGLGDLAIDETLFHAAIPNGFRQIFRLLYDTLAKRFPPDLRRFGVGRPDRLARTAHPLRDLCATVAGELGIKDLDVYVSTAQPLQLAVELTDPISLVVGSSLLDASKPAQVRFAAGRALKLATSYMSLPARLSAEELGVILAAIIRLYDPQFLPGGVAAGQIAEEAQRLARLVPKRLRDDVHPFASEISGQDFDHHALWLGVQHTGNRAGLVAGGSVLAASAVLLRQARLPDLAAGREEPQIVELLRFAVGDEHCDVRRALGH